MGNHIYYLAHYNDPEITEEDRYVSRAATTKVGYIASCFQHNGFEVDIVSPAEASGKQSYPARVVDLQQGLTLRLFHSYGRDSFIGKALNRVHIEKQLEVFLKGISSDDVLVCYHSVNYIDMLIRLKKERRFKLILEVEEVYSDVNNSLALKAREHRIFDVADAFLFPTDLLARSIPLHLRPFCVCSGVYSANCRIAGKRDDGRVHVVYAGTLDPRKGGAAAAAEAGAFLDEHYAMHILGNGNEQQIKDIESAVEYANKVGLGCVVSYDGFLTGQEFDEFIQSCHIGLSPQNPSAPFNQTSFPSKVFMYLSNGLQVVSVDLPVFTGDLRQQLFLCRSNDGIDLAKQICAAGEKLSTAQPAVAFLKKENATFCNELLKLVETINAPNKHAS